MRTTSIVCPLCPLGCDDITVQSQVQSGTPVVPLSDGAAADGAAADGAVADVTLSDGQPLSSQCEIAARQFAAAINPPVARIGSKTYQSIDWNTIGQSIGLPQIPVVEFNAPSIEESKAIEGLVSQGRIQVSWDEDAGSAAIDQAVARDGMMGATLGEVCQRADFIWVIGDIDSATPRLQRRLSQSEATIHATSRLPMGLLARLHQLRLQLALPKGRANQGIQADTDPIIEQLRNSRYVAIVVGRTPFEDGNEVIGSELLLRWMAAWNDLALPIGQGDDAPISRVVMLRFSPDQNLRAVMRWRNNQVTPVGFSQPSMANVRVGHRTRESATPVRLQIGGTDPGETIAYAYLPASSPGVHLDGASIRGDGSVTLPLYGWLDKVQPTRTEVLTRVLKLQSFAGRNRIV